MTSRSSAVGPDRGAGGDRGAAGDRGGRGGGGGESPISVGSEGAVGSATRSTASGPGAAGDRSRIDRRPGSSPGPRPGGRPPAGSRRTSCGLLGRPAGRPQREQRRGRTRGARPSESPLDALDEGGEAHAAADAERRHAPLRVPLRHGVEQRREDPARRWRRWGDRARWPRPSRSAAPRRCRAPGCRRAPGPRTPRSAPRGRCRPTASPVCSSRARTAGTGPRPMTLGSTPASV